MCSNAIANNLFNFLINQVFFAFVSGLKSLRIIYYIVTSSIARVIESSTDQTSTALSLRKSFRWNKIEYSAFTYLIRHAANGIWLHLLRRMVLVYSRNQNQCDTNRNCRYRNRVWLVRNQRRPNRRMFVPPDRKRCHSDTRIENLGPVERKTERRNKHMDNFNWYSNNLNSDFAVLSIQKQYENSFFFQKQNIFTPCPIRIVMLHTYMLEITRPIASNNVEFVCARPRAHINHKIDSSISIACARTETYR